MNESDDLTPKTVREVRIARAAWVAASLQQYENFVRHPYGEGGHDALAHFHAQFAERRYPMPTVERPRVVKSERTGYRYQLWNSEDGILITTESGTRIHDAGQRVPVIQLVDVPLIAELLANPTERVPVSDTGNES